MSLKSSLQRSHWAGGQARGLENFLIQERPSHGTFWTISKGEGSQKAVNADPRAFLAARQAKGQTAHTCGNVRQDLLIPLASGRDTRPRTAAPAGAARVQPALTAGAAPQRARWPEAAHLRAVRPCLPFPALHAAATSVSTVAKPFGVPVVREALQLQHSPRPAPADPHPREAVPVLKCGKEFHLEVQLSDSSEIAPVQPGGVDLCKLSSHWQGFGLAAAARAQKDVLSTWHRRQDQHGDWIVSPRDPTCAFQVLPTTRGSPGLPPCPSHHDLVACWIQCGCEAYLWTN